MMTESEYIRATNLAKLRAADRILRDILAGKNWGVQEEQKSANRVTSQRIDTAT